MKLCFLVLFPFLCDMQKGNPLLSSKPDLTIVSESVGPHPCRQQITGTDKRSELVYAELQPCC